MNDLRSIRKSKGLTMEQLANLSGVSSKTISLYEHTPPRRPSRKVKMEHPTSVLKSQSNMSYAVFCL
nr:helix-turn-helix transcriptional regulator [Deltaproteobacteria bacterium]